MSSFTGKAKDWQATRAQMLTRFKASGIKPLTQNHAEKHLFDRATRHIMNWDPIAGVIYSNNFPATVAELKEKMASTGFFIPDHSFPAFVKVPTIVKSTIAEDGKSTVKVTELKLAEC